MTLTARLTPDLFGGVGGRTGPECFFIGGDTTKTPTCLPSVAELPEIMEVFSNSACAWFVALVVGTTADGVSLTVRFIDADGGKLEKTVSRRSGELALLGTHVGNVPPPGVVAMASRSRAGQMAFLDPVAQRKFSTLELAWKAYLERELICDCRVPEPVACTVRHANAAAVHGLPVLPKASAISAREPAHPSTLDCTVAGPGPRIGGPEGHAVRPTLKRQYQLAGDLAMSENTLHACLPAEPALTSPLAAPSQDDLAATVPQPLEVCEPLGRGSSPLIVTGSQLVGAAPTDPRAQPVGSEVISESTALPVMHRASLADTTPLVAARPTLSELCEEREPSLHSPVIVDNTAEVPSLPLNPRVVDTTSAPPPLSSTSIDTSGAVTWPYFVDSVSDVPALPEKPRVVNVDMDAGRLLPDALEGVDFPQGARWLSPSRIRRASARDVAGTRCNGALALSVLHACADSTAATGARNRCENECESEAWEDPSTAAMVDEQDAHDDISEIESFITRSSGIANVADGTDGVASMDAEGLEMEAFPNESGGILISTGGAGDDEVELAALATTLDEMEACAANEGTIAMLGKGAVAEADASGTMATGEIDAIGMKSRGVAFFAPGGGVPSSEALFDAAEYVDEPVQPFDAAEVPPLLGGRCPLAQEEQDDTAPHTLAPAALNLAHGIDLPGGCRPAEISLLSVQTASSVRSSPTATISERPSPSGSSCLLRDMTDVDGPGVAGG